MEVHSQYGLRMAADNNTLSTYVANGFNACLSLVFELVCASPLNKPKMN